MGAGTYLEYFGNAYSPQEISALILRKLKADAEQMLGQSISDVVVTVPPYSISAQRGATMRPGRWRA